MYLETKKENTPKSPSPTTKPGNGRVEFPTMPTSVGKSNTSIHSAIKSQNILAIALCRYLYICVWINVENVKKNKKSLKKLCSRFCVSVLFKWFRPYQKHFKLFSLYFSRKMFLFFFVSTCLKKKHSEKGFKTELCFACFSIRNRHFKHASLKWSMFKRLFENRIYIILFN